MTDHDYTPSLGELLGMTEENDLREERDALRELNLELVKALREMRSMYSAYVTADGIGPALLDQADAALKHAEEVLNG